MAVHCMLPFPDRFYAAVAFTSSPPEGASPVADDARLLLYALHQQATQGACSAPKPWAWNVVESAKWSAWSALGPMDAAEAMRLYVRALGQANGEWWALLTAGGAPDAVAAASAAAAAAAAAANEGGGGSAGSGGGIGGGGSRGVDALRPPRGQWATVAVSGGRPRRRFEAAAAALGGRVVVAGGRCNGRALGDAHTLDLGTLAWRPLPLRAGGEPGGAPPAADAPDSASTRAGAACAVYGDALLLVGGAPRRATVGPPPPLEVLRLGADGTVRRLATQGDTPGARAGHTAHVLGDCLWVLGGEDARRRPVADVARLDLRSGVWTAKVPCAGAPCPRVGHVAAARGGVIYLFGGIAPGGACVGALAALDTCTAGGPTWVVPRTAGAPPAPRAGAAAAVLGDTWYIVGGGDGVASRRDTLSLRLPGDGAALAASPPLRWRVAAEAPPRSPLAAEGVALVALPDQGALLAFGGYNGEFVDDCSLLYPGQGGGDDENDEPDAQAAADASPQRPSEAPARASAATPRRQPPAPAADAEALRSAAEAEKQRADAAEMQARALRASLDDAHLRLMRAEAEAAELRGQLAAAKQYVADLEGEIRAIAAAEERAEEPTPPRRGGFLAYVTG